jgi:hypothetical protein
MKINADARLCRDARGRYGYDPTAARSPQPSAIESDLAGYGLSLDVDTIRKWLKEAAELLPSHRVRYGDRTDDGGGFRIRRMFSRYHRPQL